MAGQDFTDFILTQDEVDVLIEAGEEVPHGTPVPRPPETTRRERFEKAYRLLIRLKKYRRLQFLRYGKPAFRIGTTGYARMTKHLYRPIP